jgi:hypothetical protein
LLAATFVVLPLNVAHGSVGVLALYTTCLGIFAGAWWLLLSTPEGERPSHVRAIAAAALFFASFTTASLLVFVVVPAIHFVALYRDRDVPIWRGALGLAARYWYLLTAPIAFWFMREVWFEPAAAYAGYNTLHLPSDPLSSIGLGLTLCVVSLLVSTGALVALGSGRAHGPLNSGRAGLLLAGALTGCFAVYVLRTMGTVSLAGGLVVVAIGLSAVVFMLVGARSDIRRTDAALPLVGIALLAVGYLPYLLVEKLPSFVEWDTRHQFLMPFGVALLMTTAAVLTVRAWDGWFARISVAVMLGVMAVTAAAAPIALALDWRKQVQVIEQLRAHDELAQVRTVEFTDAMAAWNYEGRSYRFYEFTAFLDAAWGGASRFGGDSTDVTRALQGELSPILVNPLMYGVVNWRDDGSMARVVIAPREGATAWSLLFGEPAVELEIESLSGAGARG